MTTATRRRRAPMPRTRRLADNILSAYALATDAERAHGLDWYRDAHAIAADLAERHALTIEMAAGLLAVLSPQETWARNVTIARRVLADGHLPVNRDKRGKCERLLAGENPADVVSGPKVTSFYRNILDPATSDAVTIDRHAHDIADGIRRSDAQRAKAPGLTGARYVRYVDAYKLAAGELGIGALELQAVVWVAWRRVHNMPAARESVAA